MIVFAASSPSSSVQTDVPSFEADSKAESVGAKMVKVLDPAKIFLLFSYYFLLIIIIFNYFNYYFNYLII